MVQRMAMINRRAMVDNSRQGMDSKVDTVNNQLPMDNRKRRMDNNNKEEGWGNSRPESQLGQRLRPTQVAIMLQTRVTMHTVWLYRPPKANC